MPLVPVQGALRERALAKLLPQNGLLALLPDDVHQRLLPHLALADLPAGHQLGEADGGFARAYFPVAGVVALMESTADGRERIAALVGREGVVGLPRFMTDAGVTRVLVQSAGYGLALGREQLLEEWGRGGSFMRVLMRYAQAVSAQKVILEACRSQHPLDQQLASILLLAMQRLPGQEFTFAVDAAARLLGVTAAQVSDVAERLRSAGALKWRREGVLAAHDHAAIAPFACACHARVAAEYQRLLAPSAGPAAAAHGALARQPLLAGSAGHQPQRPG